MLFGGGHFLRGFVAWMLDRLNAETGFGGSAVVVKASPHRGSSPVYDQLNEQDGLFHLTLTSAQEGKAVSSTQLVTSIHRAIDPYQSYPDFVALAAQPEIRFIVSNTTEVGIAYDARDKLDDHPPGAFPAKLTVFLHQRFRHFGGAADRGCIVLPCELIEHNGRYLKRCVLRYAAQWRLGGAFAAWLEHSNTFCDTLVDRIVPGFPVERASAIRDQIGFDDRLMVEGEQYHSWVIEAPPQVQDELPTDRAGLQVTFVDDLRPYRELKVRILNGAHTCMVPIGYLYGLRTVREVVEDEALGDFISRLLFDEVLPTLDVPPQARERMAHDVLARFRNPFLNKSIAHPTDRVQDGLNTL